MTGTDLVTFARHLLVPEMLGIAEALERVPDFGKMADRVERVSMRIRLRVEEVERERHAA